MKTFAKSLHIFCVFLLASLLLQVEGTILFGGGDTLSITIYDVAREANVSMATVSRVVNGNPNVKPTTRQKVLDTIERLGYRPNAVARGLASKKTTTVGAIIPDISSTFYSELTRGI